MYFIDRKAYICNRDKENSMMQVSIKFYYVKDLSIELCSFPLNEVMLLNFICLN